MSSMQSSEDGELKQDNYEFIQPVDPVDNVLKLESDLGLFSNVIVTASYRQRNGQLLTPEIIFSALRIVIDKHPHLHTLSIPRPSEKTKGHHQAWKARLKQFDLNDCTTFLDDYDDSNVGITTLMEKTQNEWFDLKDTTRPLWKLIVVNRIHVLFVWQHIVCDAKGGIEFHKSLLSALNQVAKDGNTTHPASNLVVTSNKALPTDALILYKEKGYKGNFFATIFEVLQLIIWRWWFGNSNLFFSDSVREPSIPKLGQVKDEDRCVTSIKSMRLSSELLQKCLVACKKNKTTFTSMLATLLDVTLAIDVYPKSKARLLVRQVDLRRFLPHPDSIVNLSGTVGYFSRVEKFRQAGRELHHNPSLFWDLAREDNSWLQGQLNTDTPVLIRNSMLPSPVDEEDFAAKIIPNISLVAKNSYSLSNLGAVDSTFGMEGEQPWELSNMQFSSSATKSPIGWVLYFAILSMKGGECVINVSYEEQVLKEQRVQEIVEKAEKRLEAMFHE